MGINLQSQPRTKVRRLHLNQWLGMVMGACKSQLRGDAQVGDHWPGQLRHEVRPYLKTNKHKKSWQRGSSGSLPTKEVQGPKFKSQYDSLPHRPPRQKKKVQIQMRS
jgi:hypothetical protein